MEALEPVGGKPWTEAEELCPAGRALGRFDIEGVTVFAVEATSVSHERCDHCFLSVLICATELKTAVRLTLRHRCDLVVPSLTATKA